MKKIIAIALSIILLAVIFAGCNKSWGMGSYNFKKVHIDTYHYSGCLSVKTWHDDETGIEVDTKEAGSMFLSEGTYILISGKEPCPFCKED